MRDPVGPGRGRLTVRYPYRDTDGTAVMAAEAACGAFAGSSSAWFADDEVVRFAEELLLYPLDEGRPVHLSGGYSADGALAGEEHVGLTVRPVGRRGQVGVTVHLATPSDQHDLVEGVGDVRVVLPVSYEGLRRFATELRDLVAGCVDEAALDLEVLAG
jgi:hypothetical protein